MRFFLLLSVVWAIGLGACEHLREQHRSEVQVEPIERVVGEEDLPSQ